jgi:hypothetical protein
MSLAVSTNLFLAGLLTIFVPNLIGAIGTGGTIGLFSGLNLLAWCLVWAYVPEIVGPSYDNKRNNRTPLTLEQLFKIFRLPTSIHWAYQRKKYLPYVGSWWSTAVSGEGYPPDMPEAYFVWGEEEQKRRGKQPTEPNDRDANGGR